MVKKGCVLLLALSYYCYHCYCCYCCLKNLEDNHAVTKVVLLLLLLLFEKFGGQSCCHKGCVVVGKRRSLKKWTRLATGQIQN